LLTDALAREREVILVEYLGRVLDRRVRSPIADPARRMIAFTGQDDKAN
jgi:hypothetical protein